MNDLANSGMIDAIKSWRSDKCLAVSTAAQRKHDAEAAKLLNKLLNMIESGAISSARLEVNVSGDWRRVSLDDAISGAWLGYPVRINCFSADERY